MPITTNDIKITWYEGRESGGDLISSDLCSIEAVDTSKPYHAPRIITADCDERVIRVHDQRGLLCEVFRIEDRHADARLAKYEPAHKAAEQAADLLPRPGIAASPAQVQL